MKTIFNLKNWYFRILLSCIILVVGGIIWSLTGWPYLGYLGIILFGGIIIYWTLFAVVVWIKNKFGN